MADYYPNALVDAPNQGVQATDIVNPGFQAVRIEKVSNGFICSIGCKNFVASTWAELSKGLDLYWKDPGKARKQYCKDEVKK